MKCLLTKLMYSRVDLPTVSNLVSFGKFLRTVILYFSTSAQGLSESHRTLNLGRFFKQPISLISRMLFFLR